MKAHKSRTSQRRAWHKSNNGATNHKSDEKLKGDRKYDDIDWWEQGEWNEHNTQSWSSSHEWEASEKLRIQEVPKAKDARLPLPPLDSSEFGQVVTADEAKGYNWTCKEDFFDVIKRPGGFTALLEAELDPYQLWKKLQPCPELRPPVLPARAPIGSTGEPLAPTKIATATHWVHSNSKTQLDPWVDARSPEPETGRERSSDGIACETADVKS
jgi:hypothetical protein